MQQAAQQAQLAAASASASNQAGSSQDEEDDDDIWNSPAEVLFPLLMFIPAQENSERNAYL